MAFPTFVIQKTSILFSVHVSASHFSAYLKCLSSTITCVPQGSRQDLLISMKDLAGAYELYA